MKLVHTEISRLTNELLSIEPIMDANLQCPFNAQPEYHSHPELELLYVIEGNGTRIINGIAESFESGDMILMGPGVPHIWITDESNINIQDNSPKAILVYFNIFKFQELFNSLKEFSDIKKLINNSRKGVKIHGETRDTIGKMLLELHSEDGYPQIEGILRILHIISQSKEKSFVIANLHEPAEHDISDRMVPVLKFINDNLHHPITLEQVAELACMTENAFCRFFRSRLKKNFSQYLREQRIAKACSLLVQTGRSISDISDLCGYRSTSHFSQVFKSRIKLTPFQYRRSVEKVS